MNGNPIGYVLSRYPDPSEAYIRYEMAEASKLAGRIVIIPVVKACASPDAVL